MTGIKWPKRLGWTRRTVRTYIYTDNRGFNPHERRQYVSIRDRNGDVIGTGETVKEALHYANETLNRRAA